jgi:TRAP-type mannitol/chloroaromatic compound transport system permease large subunit
VDLRLGRAIETLPEWMRRELGASVGDLYEGALIPGLTLTAFYALYVFIVSIVKPEAVPAPEMLEPEALLGPEAIVTALGRQGIWLRSLADPHCLRACTHICTEEAEIKRLLDALARIS